MCCGWSGGLLGWWFVVFVFAWVGSVGLWAGRLVLFWWAGVLVLGGLGGFGGLVGWCGVGLVGWWVGWVGGVVLGWLAGWWFGVLVGCFVVVWCCLFGGWLWFVWLVGWWSCGSFVSVLLVLCWVCFASRLSSLCALVFVSVCYFA